MSHPALTKGFGLINTSEEGRKIYRSKCDELRINHGEKNDNKVFRKIIKFPSILFERQTDRQGN